MSNSASLLRLVRTIHLYFGVFIAPALLFFAITGAIQTLSLHEAAGTDYKAPALLAELGQLHKKQTTEFPKRPAQPEGARPPAPAAAKPPTPALPPVTLAGKQKQHLPMKLFFLAVSLGLFTSVLTGLFMSYKYARNKSLVTAALITGALLPLLLLKL
ncbi:MAG TPA: hypothetical protein VM865_04360 [Acidobacteriaceae bacterium]|jgi:hypothetical protein|nr:hypothetical protein [Acidobacteriaceae bacterium]